MTDRAPARLTQTGSQAGCEFARPDTSTEQLTSAAMYTELISLGDWAECSLLTADCSHLAVVLGSVVPPWAS